MLQSWGQIRAVGTSQFENATGADVGRVHAEERRQRCQPVGMALRIGTRRVRYPVVGCGLAAHFLFGGKRRPRRFDSQPTPSALTPAAVIVREGERSPAISP